MTYDPATQEPRNFKQLAEYREYQRAQAVAHITLPTDDELEAEMEADFAALEAQANYMPGCGPY